jgi:RNA polymerase sigma-70 factor (ECF subfamily)
VSSSLSLEAILTEYAPLLARIAASYEAIPTLQQDLLQDISLAIWRALDSYESKASLKTYIAKIAHNRCIDHVLKAKRNRLEYVDDFDAQGEKSIQGQSKPSSEQRLDMMSAVRKLSVSLRQVISMQLEGFTQAEIAEILGIKESAVAQRSSRATQLLKQHFSENQS